ncbi:vacuolar protein sorting-associated protein 2 homolog 3-like isoform X1 [Cucurbita pepo subsp. pepo]|uniref:vacuolar protein sorting-associated protein 2 homolog 3-like isoform X1 n=2 Tax=Cucurbita pepo subsp. pepo TaxID=3664 RepID=UPI000C9D4623|nr:vacuolar protein sorting-associated protein 2 homolog 3-like isoform X1 [Cucurbita pepo subsp. pepo]
MFHPNDYRRIGNLCLFQFNIILLTFLFVREFPCRNSSKFICVVLRIILLGAMNIFSKKPDAKEALRESKREMTRSTRGIEKEIGALQLEEKKLVAEIKRTAKTGNEAATKILARQLVRLRQQIANLQGSRAQMRGIATHTQAMHAQTSVAAGMKSAGKAMSVMNKQMDPAKQAKVIREFQKQSAQMDMTTEMISDAIDDALDDDLAEEETEDLTNQVLDEIGVDVASQLSSAPKGRIAPRNTEGVSSSSVDELEKRLAALRNP